MRIGINIKSLQDDNQFRGVGFYTQNLINHLKKLPGVEVVESIGKFENIDLVHYPSFDLFSPTLPLFKVRPIVVTIHDLIPLVFPQCYPVGIKGNIFFHYQKLALKKADAVITDSSSSKKDIIKFLGVEENIIYPIYLAPSEEFVKITNPSKLLEVIKKYNLPENFILYTGNVNFNKNILNIAKAVIGAGITLVMVGKGFENTADLNHPELKSYREFLEITKDSPLIHKLGFIPNEELVAVYNLAKIVLLPSYYEGFGLPILEAQACGVPVITANVSSMPEVAGSSALMVSPQNPLEIAEAIKKLLLDKSLRTKLINAGFENIKRFSWQKVAEDSYSVYQKVLK